jgi:hypothetical protein
LRLCELNANILNTKHTVRELKEGIQTDSYIFVGMDGSLPVWDHCHRCRVRGTSDRRQGSSLSLAPHLAAKKTIWSEVTLLEISVVDPDSAFQVNADSDLCYQKLRFTYP